MHLLFECHWAKMLWDFSELDLEGRRFPSFRDVLDWVWLNSGVAKTKLFATLCWQVWKARNELVFENRQAPPLLYVRSASDWLKDYHHSLSMARSSGSCSMEKLS